MTDNLQGSMGDAAWEARAAEKRPYRVLPPGAPGEVAYWMAMALFADMEARQDLVEAALVAAGEAVGPSTNADAHEYTNDDLLREQQINEFEMWRGPRPF